MNTTIKNVKINKKEDTVDFRINYDARVREILSSHEIQAEFSGETLFWTMNLNKVPLFMLKLADLSNVDYTALNTAYLKYMDSQNNFKTPVGMRYKLFHHQEVAVIELLKNKKMILGDSMGLGKTQTAIITAYNIAGRKLIVCPAHLKLNWLKEMKLSGIDENDVVVVNSRGFEEAINSDKEWIVINYELLQKINAIEKWADNFAVAVFDEVHYCKAVDSYGRPNTKRAKKSVAIANRIDRVYLLTGTPMPERTKDIWIPLVMIGRPIKSYRYFENRYCNPYFNGYGWDSNGSSNQTELYTTLRPYMIRRLSKDVLDLPEKIRSQISVSVNLRSYYRLLKEYRSMKNGNRSDAVTTLMEMKHEIANAKAVECKKFVEDLVEQGKPVVIFTYYRDVVDYFMRAFEKADCIIGGMSNADKHSVVEKFQGGDINVLICTYGAASTGINLTRSETIIFNDFDFSAANMCQAEDRIWRIGQKNRCNILYLYAEDTVDEQLLYILDEKVRNINAVVDNKEVDGVFSSDNVMEQMVDYIEKMKN